MTGVTTWQQSKARTLAWCESERARSIALLGGKCVRCGSKKKLEFHHTKTRTWIASAMNRWSRLAAYKRDIERGEIELLCKRCNQRAGKPKDDPEYTPEDLDF